MMVEVRKDDLHSAFVRWSKHHPLLSAVKKRTTFSQFLGTPLPVFMGLFGTWEVPQHTAHKMRLLLGPHDHAVVKAYHAIKGAE